MTAVLITASSVSLQRMEYEVVFEQTWQYCLDMIWCVYM